MQASSVSRWLRVYAWGADSEVLRSCRRFWRRFSARPQAGRLQQGLGFAAMSDSPIRTVLRVIDLLDLEAAVAMFAPDATLVTAFGEHASGTEQVRGAFVDLLGGLRAAQHKVSGEWNPEPGLWIAEVTATYELTDFSRRGPFERAIILRSGDGGVTELRIYGAHELPVPETGGGYLDVRGPSGWLPTL